MTKIAPCPTATDSACRNCISHDVDIANSGIIAPFFFKRVYGLHIQSLAEAIETKISPPRKGVKLRLAWSLYQLLKKANLTRRIFSFRGGILSNIRICRNCGFVGPDKSYDYEMLKGLYHDYRSATYNQDRCGYEPSYRHLQSLVGKDPSEVESRLNHVDAILKAHADTGKIRTVLDWGGGEGRFIPRELSDREVTILDVSGEEPVNRRYSRIDQLREDLRFDYIQICHVLEHVSSPKRLLEQIVRSGNPGCLIYIEVPQDRSDEEIEGFIRRPGAMKHMIHEHLNLYSVGAVSALGRALDLKELVVKKSPIHFGWASGSIISGLFTKPY